MSFQCGNLTPTASTGNQSFTGIGFKPSMIIITCAKYGSTDSTANFSEGCADGTRQSARAIFSDTTGAKTDKTNTGCVLHLNRSGSSIVTAMAASFVSFDTDGFTLNFSTVPSGNIPQLNVKCFA